MLELACNASVSALFAGKIIAPKFSRISRHEIAQAAMDADIPLVSAFVLTYSGFVERLLDACYFPAA